MSTEFAPKLLTWTRSPVPGTADREVYFTDLFADDRLLIGVVFYRDGEQWATVIGYSPTDGTETNVALAHGTFGRDAAKDWVTDTILLLNLP
ncbi:hypothetical protein [Nocardia sp. NPDC060249]|uniref:hypothetical protein n=1 Tax=Nocardia sp. NPDC060249 TaxID=3347082 RepID=UPI003653F9EB